MNGVVDDGLASAIADGWVWKAAAVLAGPIGAIAAWAAKRPLEAAGVRDVLDKSLMEHNDRLTLQLNNERARCDEEIKAVEHRFQAEIDRLMKGRIATWGENP